MPRNSSGIYTLPSGNPVVSGTLIEASWANTTLSDLSSAMTGSLSRGGEGGMTAALRVVDGTLSVPGLAFANETSSGLYRAGAGDFRLSVLGTAVAQFLSTGVSVTGTLGVSGATTLTGALTLNGGIANNPVLTAGTANGVTYLNGSKALTSGTALTFDGTNLVTTGGVSAVNLSYTGTLTGGTGVVNLGSGQVYKDASGNLGLGVTPSAWVSGDTILQVKAGSSITSLWGRNASGRLISNAYYDGTNYKYYATGTATSFETNVGGGYNWNIAASGTAGNAITFTQAMTLDSSGNLLVGTTSNLGANARLNVAYAYAGDGAAWKSDSTLNHNAIIFVNPNGTVGAIRTNGSATAYATSSDYRLKEAIAPMTGALAKVAMLKPCTYKWKVDGSDGQGFIAHELAEVEAGCVTGEKDAVDADGNPQYQGIDTSFLVATLAAAIQELKAIVDAQGAEIAALKSI